MVGARVRRQQVAYTRSRGLSDRRACAVLSVARSTLGYQSRLAVRDAPALTAMRRLAAQYPRYGYRRIRIFLRREGHVMSPDRTHRLWRQAGLQVPRRRPRRRVATGRPRPLPPTARNHVWAYDFVFDTCANRQTLKCLTIVDEWTRECLAIDVAGGIRSGRVIEVLAQLVSVHGAPRHLRSDNGPEFVATAILRWLGDAGIDTALIDPGKPWQNATDESFNGKFRDEFLSLQWFRNRMDAKVGIEQWRQHYNEVRPHSSLGYLTPAEFKAQLRAGSDDGGRSSAMPARADQEEHGDVTAVTRVPSNRSSSFVSPGLDDRVWTRLERRLGEALVAIEPAVERFDRGVLIRLARLDQAQRDAVRMGPCQRRARRTPSRCRCARYAAGRA